MGFPSVQQASVMAGQASTPDRDVHKLLLKTLVSIVGSCCIAAILIGEPPRTVRAVVMRCKACILTATTAWTCSRDHCCEYVFFMPSASEQASTAFFSASLHVPDLCDSMIPLWQMVLCWGAANAVCCDHASTCKALYFVTAGAAYWVHHRRQRRADSTRDCLVSKQLSLRTSKDTASTRGAHTYIFNFGKADCPASTGIVITAHVSGSDSAWDPHIHLLQLKAVPTSRISAPVRRHLL